MSAAPRPRMLPWVAAALLAGLCGCAPAGRDAGCSRVADDDPSVRYQEMRILGNPQSQAHYQPDLVEARQRAELACLRARGEAPPGGVQARPSSMGRF